VREKGPAAIQPQQEQETAAAGFTATELQLIATENELTGEQWSERSSSVFGSFSSILPPQQCPAHARNNAQHMPATMPSICPTNSALLATGMQQQGGRRMGLGRSS